MSDAKRIIYDAQASGALRADGMRAHEGMGRVTASRPLAKTILLRAINRHATQGNTGEANTWQG